ncbi:restriction endonuclease subunit S [Bisgaard Taxon 46]
MTKINILQMIEQSQVKWKTLGAILIRTKGTKITAGKMKELHKDNGEIKIFAGGKTFALVNAEDIPMSDVNHNPSIIVKSRGIIEFEYYDKPFSHKNEMWSYYSNNDEINIKFIYYFLKQNEQHFQQIGSKMQMPQIATPDTDKFLVPIPPISLQQEIVRILDALTAVTSELTSELKLRQKQYQYYRDHLLSFGDDVEWKSLGEVCHNIFSGKNKDRCIDGAYPIYGSTGIIGRTNNFMFEEDRILVARVGANAGFVHIAMGKYDVSDNTLIVENMDSISMKYLYYYLKHMNLNQFAKGAGQPLITGGQLKALKIPIPPFAEQQRIVEILDKFDRLTHSLSEGLPKEIELRRKQCEYYREKLLNFPK